MGGGGKEEAEALAGSARLAHAGRSRPPAAQNAPAGSGLYGLLASESSAARAGEAIGGQRVSGLAACEPSAVSAQSAPAGSGSSACRPAEPRPPAAKRGGLRAGSGPSAHALRDLGRLRPRARGPRFPAREAPGSARRMES